MRATNPKQPAENSMKTAHRRKVPGRPFQPGQSGNPGGRPKALPEVRQLARQYTRKAIAALVKVLCGKSDAVRIRAAEALLDRAWGPPIPCDEPPRDRPAIQGDVIIVDAREGTDSKRSRQDSAAAGDVADLAQ